jgi:uncharacterized membrane protein YebE (DUF533 family)
MNRIALIALALIATSTAASANPYDSSYGRERRIDTREAIQADRIYRARQRGDLTWFESFRLKHEQARIRRMEAAAKADGYVSRYEARQIERAQDRASDHIYGEAHDRQRAWWRRWY